MVILGIGVRGNGTGLRVKLESTLGEGLLSFDVAIWIVRGSLQIDTMEFSVRGILIWRFTLRCFRRFLSAGSESRSGRCFLVYT